MIYTQRQLRNANRRFADLVAFLMTCSNEEYVAGTMVIESLPMKAKSYSISDLVRDMAAVEGTPEHASRMELEAEYLSGRPARREVAA